jgi:two-component system, chemotaxis family, CheB/CheR fusion protein
MDRSPIVVAVASSAGDLDAVSELLSALPAECAAALIVVQHLDSGRERLLFEALGERTIPPVMRAHDGAVVEQGHVYVMTAKTTLTMTDGRIRVTPNLGGQQHPGDILFTSLAKQCGHSAIGVVLSGEGSDGSLGIQALKGAGGTSLAQYPGSARFPSMPINAIETGCVRFVLRPNEIARELARLSGYASHASSGDDREPRSRGGGASLSRTDELRGRAEAPDQSRGHTLSSRARGDTTVPQREAG